MALPDHGGVLGSIKDSSRSRSVSSGESLTNDKKTPDP
ncbi:hypothetical protein M595_5644 [Lyngbya aestuarii BL J]|uniref:Uncharacterized protein n=1 Tax=Lyngbya aestuarii BL J TaxID=1348334 RepID=U7QB50_9CYAN|nr:hypothetical protein M595_5644 [Lyngbya aestuarii BL J]